MTIEDQFKVALRPFVQRLLRDLTEIAFVLNCLKVRVLVELILAESIRMKSRTFSKSTTLTFPGANLLKKIRRRMN